MNRFFPKILYITIISIIPVTSRLRAKLYSLVPNYSCSKANIGFGSLINVQELKADKESIIGCFVVIWECGTLSLSHKSSIKSFNKFSYIAKISLFQESTIGKKNVFSGPRDEISFHPNKFSLGKKSAITGRHIFDLVDDIIIGDNVVLAGANSQIWTHFFDLERNRIQCPVTIGNNIMIGSQTIILPGVRICNNVVITAGTRISSDIIASGLYGNNTEIIRFGNIKIFSASSDYVELGKFHDKSFLRKGLPFMDES